jgi:PST family polysaccharide transporter
MTQPTPKAHDLIDHDHVEGGTDDLGDRAKRGSAIVFGAMLLQRGIGLICLALLARKLNPEDFGLVGMVAVLSSILTIFADLGLPEAVVQKADLTRRELSAAFWLNVLASCVIGGIMVAMAHPLAWFYNDARLVKLTLLFAIYFPLLGLGAQHYALLVRRMQYKRLALSETIGFGVGGVSGIWFAAHGYGASALILQQIVNITIITSMNWCFAHWLPGLPSRQHSLRGMVHVGGNLTASKLVEYVIRNLDNFLLGRFCGAAPLGLYTRAYTLMTYPILLVSSPIARVTMPVLAKLQHDLPRLRQGYVRVLQMIAFISFPLMLGLIVTGEQVIRVIYGGKWTSVVPIFQILCLAGLYQGIYGAVSQLLVATGRTDRMLRCNFVLCAAVTIAFGIGVNWGPRGMATAYTATMTILILPYLAYAYQTVDLKLRKVLAALRAPFLAAMTMAGIVWLLEPPTGPGWHPLIRMIVSGAIGAAAYLGLMAFFARRFMSEVVVATLTGMVPPLRRFFHEQPGAPTTIKVGSLAAEAA